MKTFNFDFSRPRVRLNGRSLSKFDLAMAIDSFCHSLPMSCHICFPLVTTIYPQEFEYSFYVEQLKHYLSIYENFH